MLNFKNIGFVSLTMSLRRPVMTVSSEPGTAGVGAVADGEAGSLEELAVPLAVAVTGAVDAEAVADGSEVGAEAGAEIVFGEFGDECWFWKECWGMVCVGEGGWSLGGDFSKPAGSMPVLARRASS